MYCNIEDVRNVDDEGITTGLSDIEMEELIQMASDYVDSYTERFFDIRFMEYQLDDMKVLNKIVYFDVPIRSIKKVEYNGTKLVETEYRYRKDDNRLYLSYYYSEMIVKGEFGYKSIPVRIKKATALLSIFLTKQLSDTSFSGNIKREKVDIAELEYNLTSSIFDTFPSSIQLLLDDYKRLPYFNKV